MAPPPAKPKKAKKTKAEIEEDRLLAVEEARKEAALDAATALQIENTRLANVAKTEEAQRVFRENEVARLSESYEDYRHVVESKRNTLLTQKIQQTQSKNWASYTTPTNLPNLTEADLNTYLSQLKPDLSNKVIPYVPCMMHEALEVMETTEKIIDVLFEKIAVLNGESPVNSKEISALSRFVPLLRVQSNEVFDLATANVISKSDQYITNHEENDIKLSNATKKFKCFLWINLFKKSTFKYKVLDYTSDIGISISIPKPFVNAHVGVRGVHFPYEQISERFGTRSLVLGGVFVIDIIKLPKMVKRIKSRENWVMRSLVTEHDDVEDREALDKVNYPIGTADGVVVGIAPAIKCTLQIPSGIIISDTPTVAWFNPVSKQWEFDSITDINYDNSSGVLGFHTVSVGSIAIVQDKTIDFPYKSWSLNSIMCDDNKEKIHFQLETQRFNFVIEVCDDGLCALLQPDIKELAELRKRRMEIGQLLSRLKNSGVNVMPVNDNSSDGVGLKDEVLEDTVYEEVSNLCTSYDFHSCSPPTISSLSKDQISVLVKETDAYTGLGGTELIDYNTLLCENDVVSESYINSSVGSVEGGIKFSIIEGAANESEGASEGACEGEESSNTAFSTKIADDSETQIYMIKAIASIGGAESVERVENCKGGVAGSVRALLKLIRPFSFC